MHTENPKGLTLTSILNLLLIFCLLRFSLVFTTRWNVFSLTLVVLAGVIVIFSHVLVSKRYAGQLMQSNLLFLVLNIFCVFVIQHVTVNPSYAGHAAAYIKQLLVLVILWGFYLYIKRLSIKQHRRLVGIYLFAIAVSAAYTFYAAATGEDGIIRNTAFGQYDSSFSLAYGGFDFIYGLVLVYVTLLIVLTNGFDKIKPFGRITIIFLLVLMALTIIVSAYSTAFILILFSTIFIAPKKVSTKFILLSLVVFCVYVIPVPLTNWFKSLSFIPELTTSRISDIILSFTGQGSTAYITDDGQRLDRVFWSLKAFIANPLLGLFGENGTETLGYHTEWIEQLARYGIITAAFNIGFWCTTFKRMEIMSRHSSIAHKCVVSTFIIYFLLGFLNPISMVVTSAPLFVLGPFASNLFVDEL